MGYRSKVIIGIKTDKLYMEFDAILTKHGFNADNVMDYLVIHRHKEDDMSHYIFKEVKWYETEDWCKEIMGWLEAQDDNKIDRQDGVIDVYCVGMGEDGKLHYEIGFCHHYVDIVSHIGFLD